MVLKMLKKAFSGKKTCAEELGEELADLLFNLNSEAKILDAVAKDYGNDFAKNLDLLLACSHLFSYKLVIRINDIRINSKLLEEIYDNFSVLVSEQRLKEHKIDVAKLEEKVENLAFAYQKNFAAKKNVEISKVIELLCAELKEEIDLNLKKDLSNFLLQNITIIQDFLVDKSLYLRAKY
ncbi:hypothetical protein [Halanaerobacter jeridensis]|uniref:Proline dehydrogenase n=1 Tax=Halanaerobacter jeridensis TaxID=706427 RepID=A0A938XXF9_9FIRM|nr:hypothetical protein [Halanaerobacter jeridensis]MBM7558041.1 proline dehydrogenase [Halanaerobacter jeridensis]